MKYQHSARQQSTQYKIKNISQLTTLSQSSVSIQNLKNTSLSRDTSLRLVPSLDRNRPLAENTRSVSTEVGGIVSK